MASHFGFTANQARMVLSKVRGGDYAHAGDREATQMVLKRALGFSPEMIDGPCLDVGSGFGGTAQDMHQFGFKYTWGIDRDRDAISYARERYPEVSFLCADAEQIPCLFEPHFFSLITLFNVFYAIEDKLALLKKLASVAKEGAILAVFDYTSKNEKLSIKDLADRPMYPMSLGLLEKDLALAGWKVLEMHDLSDEYRAWYKKLLAKLEGDHSLLAQEFSERDIERVRATFTDLLAKLENDVLGGAVVYAQRTRI